MKPSNLDGENDDDEKAIFRGIKLLPVALGDHSDYLIWTDQDVSDKQYITNVSI